MARWTHCSCCGFRTNCDRFQEGEKEGWLCVLCRNTMAGTAHFFPSGHPDGDVLAGICFVGNAIIGAVRRTD